MLFEQPAGAVARPCGDQHHAARACEPGYPAAGPERRPDAGIAGLAAVRMTPGGAGIDAACSTTSQDSRASAPDVAMRTASAAVRAMAPPCRCRADRVRHVSSVALSGIRRTGFPVNHTADRSTGWWLRSAAAGSLNRASGLDPAVIPRSSRSIRS
jgi:hypothetical protein